MTEPPPGLALSRELNKKLNTGFIDGTSQQRLTSVSDKFNSVTQLYHGHRDFLQFLLEDVVNTHPRAPYSDVSFADVADARIQHLSRPKVVRDLPSLENQEQRWRGGLSTFVGPKTSSLLSALRALGLCDITTSGTRRTSECTMCRIALHAHNTPDTPTEGPNPTQPNVISGILGEPLDALDDDTDPSPLGGDHYLIPNVRYC